MNKQPLLILQDVWQIDIDGSLVIHVDRSDLDHDLEVKCPYLGDNIRLKINSNNVRMLKEKAVQGYYIEVHTQGRALWAESVIKALGILEYVDVMKGKPTGIIDDMPASAWMPDNTNLPLDLVWKA